MWLLQTWGGQKKDLPNFVYMVSMVYEFTYLNDIEKYKIRFKQILYDLFNSM